MTDPIAWYEANADAVSARYESVPAEAVHGWLVHLLPSPPALILDVGAGSGRDAAWLAGLSYDVVAVEPSPAMRKAAEGRRPDRRIRWLGDRLPGLEQTLRTGLSFDFIVLSAVADASRPGRSCAGLPQADHPSRTGRHPATEPPFNHGT